MDTQTPSDVLFSADIRNITASAARTPNRDKTLPAFGPAQLVIIQPTPLCNLNCSYCYLPDRRSQERITMDTLRAIGKMLFSPRPRVVPGASILWHAGEPFVLPVNFYREAFRAIEGGAWNHGAIKHSFQTNGTLITQEWCDFIRERDIEVGVSVDGPKAIHDAFRRDWADNGTFGRTLRGIRLLRKNQIPVRVISVISRFAIEHPDQLIEFFLSEGITDLAFNAENAEGCHKITSLQEYSEERLVSQYKQFFSCVLEYQLKFPQLRVRELDFMLRCIRDGEAGVSSQESTPGAILSFDSFGNVSTFSPQLLTINDSKDRRFVFGNVHADSLDDIFTSLEYRSFELDVSNGVERCRRACEYFAVCGGGAPINKISELGTADSTETRACRLRVKAVADVALEHLECLCGLSS